VTLTAVVKGIPVPSDGLVSVTRLASNMQTVVQTDASLSGVTVPAASGILMVSSPESPATRAEDEAFSSTAVIVGVAVPVLLILAVAGYMLVRQPDSLGQHSPMEDKTECALSGDERSTMSDASDLHLAKHPHLVSV
jgi:cytochrome c-type biogenesis protein CcmH/NrfG